MKRKQQKNEGKCRKWHIQYNIMVMILINYLCVVLIPRFSYRLNGILNWRSRSVCLLEFLLYQLICGVDLIFCVFE